MESRAFADLGFEAQGPPMLVDYYRSRNYQILARTLAYLLGGEKGIEDSVDPSELPNQATARANYSLASKRR